MQVNGRGLFKCLFNQTLSYYSGNYYKVSTSTFRSWHTLSGTNTQPNQESASRWFICEILKFWKESKILELYVHKVREQIQAQIVHFIVLFFPLTRKHAHLIVQDKKIIDEKNIFISVSEHKKLST